MRNDDLKRMQRIKNILLRNTLLSMLGYFAAISASCIAKYFNLTSCSYADIGYMSILVIIVIGTFTLIIYLQKNITITFRRIIDIAQLAVWLIICGIWLNLMNEIRILALFAAVMPLVFYFSIGNIVSSLIVVTLFEVMYISISYYGITYGGQPGSFKLELFHSYCSFFTAIFLIMMSHIYRRQKQMVKSQREKTEITAMQLEKTNRELVNTYKETQELVALVTKLSGQVAEETILITDSSEDLSKDASIQAKSINDVTETTIRINEKTSTNYNNAMGVNELVVQAKSVSDNNVIKMKDMDAAITNISESSKEIARIIKTIDDIAFQTNLLALNAAIEAARAGKNGRGFAVVAQEVRTLAAKSAKASSNTAELIEKSIEKVKTGTKISEQTVLAMNDINEKISFIANLTEEITVSSEEQAAEISQVAKEMIKISDITNETEKNAKKTNDAANKVSYTTMEIRSHLKAYEGMD
jgi:hypothetical protein